MARVCVECGLKLDADGNLIVNTDDAVWPWACDEENLGSSVYCSASDGALRVDPPIRVSTIQSTGENVVREYPNREIPDDITELATNNLTVKNPSTCYSAILDYTITLDMDISVRAGGRVRFRLDNNQVFDYTNQGNATVNDSGWNVSTRYVRILAPNETYTITPKVEYDANGTGGTISKLEQQITGTIIAAPFVTAQT